ncbi:Calcineurin-like phosphoesterase superfamily domain protein [Aquisphaera giovannonii]|uniref:Calcineurin-like phosphoesterase superfamily domain protein n=1 Tax=Aquisphaera giovannonii TaxID=406548 RepID=A0A5B9W3X7_9BACT|nr:metallophosphoesterase [Aquisphaera giovannonii]QEH34954.1 Calcineurin-like phosphoesterase superfamily domain protein [Aquisphaera giovannonii]
MIEPQRPVVFVVPGDLHLTDPGLENHRVAEWMVGEVNRLIRPDFVQFIGDNVQDATADQFRLFDGLRSRLDCPHFALVGDHDVKDDPAAQGFRKHVGETYGSTSLRGFRLIRLDTQQARPVGLVEGQVAWLRAELEAAAAAGERVVIFQHNYPYQIWEDFSGPGIDDWRALVQAHRIDAIVCGHTHYWQVANDGRNAYVAVRSIGDPEGGAAGYCVGLLDGEDFAIAYRTVDDAGPLVLITHPRESLLATGPPHVVVGPDVVRARIWSEEPVIGVRGRIDDGPWFPLSPAGDGDWSAPLPGRLEKGEHALAVEAEAGPGGRASHQIRFVVDPTGRYTPVPEVRPKVTRTDFC